MTRTVADTAAMLTAMAGTDPSDAWTKAADDHKTDYLAALKADSLEGDPRWGAQDDRRPLALQTVTRCSRTRSQRCARRAPCWWK